MTATVKDLTKVDVVDNLISLSGSQEDCPVFLEECIIPDDQLIGSQDGMLLITNDQKN